MDTLSSPKTKQNKKIRCNADFL